MVAESARTVDEFAAIAHKAAIPAAATIAPHSRARAPISEAPMIPLLSSHGPVEGVPPITNGFVIQKLSDRLTGNR
jgi:hypothetical protein